MKKIIFTMLLALPLGAAAQNVWEAPVTYSKPKTEKKSLFEKNEHNYDPKYLTGAVPEVNGKVVFALDVDAPGKSQTDIYNAVKGAMQEILAQDNQFEDSKIAIDQPNKQLAARYREWLVFENKALSLDQTVFLYTLIADCTDGHLHMTMERMSYQYEMERDGAEGQQMTAEEWITDKWALNKKKTSLARYSGKFRRKTIDRKDYIFDLVKKALK